MKHSIDGILGGDVKKADLLLTDQSHEGKDEVLERYHGNGGGKRESGRGRSWSGGCGDF